MDRERREALDARINALAATLCKLNPCDDNDKLLWTIRAEFVVLRGALSESEAKAARLEARCAELERVIPHKCGTCAHTGSGPVKPQCDTCRGWGAGDDDGWEFDEARFGSDRGNEVSIK